MPSPTSLKDKLYTRFVRPKSADEDMLRRESIFNILLLGLLTLTFVALCYMVANEIVKGPRYAGLSPLTLLLSFMLLVGIYWASRRHFWIGLVYIFVGLYLVLGTFALYVYSYALPEGLLTYVVVIIISGILISSRAALGAIALVIIALAVLSFVQVSGFTHPDLQDLTNPILPGHILIYFFFFAVIFLVAWLSNRDRERSLERARQSEKALLKERNSLEIKVRQRTKELENAQAEQILQLQRFAEFGRLSSTLLHDLANPLTAVSLELEQLSGTEHFQVVSEARKGIAAMERYVEAARRQLRNQSETQHFNVAEVIRRVVGLAEPRAKALQVKFGLKLDDAVEFVGDSVRFDQVMANLVANALDAYEEVPAKRPRQVQVTMSITKKQLQITVADRAAGLTPAELRRIFDAFYTTKSPERGSGLGLSIIRRTLEEDFRGSISVVSQKGDGACFSIKLPLKLTQRRLQLK